LKDENSHTRFERIERLKERRSKEVGVEKIFVRLSRAISKSRQLGKSFDRDVVGHLEREQKILRHLRDKAFNLARRWKLVVRAIDANRFEDLRVFREA